MRMRASRSGSLVEEARERAVHADHEHEQRGLRVRRSPARETPNASGVSARVSTGTSSSCTARPPTWPSP